MKEVDDTLFPKFLWDIELLNTRHEALLGAFLNFVKEKYPGEEITRGESYERVYKKNALKALYEIPQVNAALREKLKRELRL